MSETCLKQVKNKPNSLWICLWLVSVQLYIWIALSFVFSLVFFFVFQYFSSHKCFTHISSLQKLFSLEDDACFIESKRVFVREGYIQEAVLILVFIIYVLDRRGHRDNTFLTKKQEYGLFRTEIYALISYSILKNRDSDTFWYEKFAFLQFQRFFCMWFYNYRYSIDILSHNRIGFFKSVLKGFFLCI